MSPKQKNVYALNYSNKVYDFMCWDYVAFALSAILIIFSIAIMILQGFNWGIDFTGGTVIQLHLDKIIDIERIRDALNNAGLNDPIVQNFGNQHDVIIRMSILKENNNQDIGNKIISVINQVTNYHASIKQVDFIGPSVGSDLVQDSIMAILVALLCILLYVICRFEWRLATGVVLSLVHDLFITLGCLSLFKIEIDLTIIASLMSVIAYSLNDSIIVLDRIRDNCRKNYHISTYDIFNISLTQIVSRTIMTSMTILLVVFILLIFGGKILLGFSITLCIGVIIGSISSIYIASTLGLKLGIKREDLLRTNKEKSII